MDQQLRSRPSPRSHEDVNTLISTICVTHLHSQVSDLLKTPMHPSRQRKAVISNNNKQTNNAAPAKEVQILNLSVIICNNNIIINRTEMLQRKRLHLSQNKHLIQL